MHGTLAVVLLAACGPTPPVWPRRFTLVQRRTPDPDAAVEPATTVTYYDADRGANLIVITPDSNMSDVFWDLELDDHRSYYFTPTRRSCKPMEFPVGILRTDWLANATALGPSVVNGRDVLGFTKVDFIDYYADAQTCEPVRWYFHTMKARFDSIYWAPGLAAPDASWFTPPEYCAGDERVKCGERSAAIC
mmetsp:Transcript_36701/g.117911  ORF Transcript_36701/g.117911 Transcript_36701/m.117911 type:complete len:191 (-) Transcript_36701:2960-3532(-)|eukprot:scaffold2190_cov118-Isochrysis_galbana.AAC.4